MHVFNEKVITLVIGPPGSGKSTFAAKLVKEANKKDVPAYCNYPVLGSIEVNLGTMVDYNLGEAVLIIDEAGLSFNSRDFKKFTSALYHWMATTRHRGTQIFFLVQSWKRIDTILRELATEVVMCRKGILGFTTYQRYRSDLSLVEDEKGQALEFQEVFKRLSWWFFYRPKYYHMFDTKHLDRDYRDPADLLPYPEVMFPPRKRFLDRFNKPVPQEDNESLEAS